MRSLPLMILLAFSLILPAAAFAQEGGDPTTGDETAQGNDTSDTAPDEAAANDTAEEGAPEGEAPAEEEAPVGPLEITMTSHQEGSAFWFEVEGMSGRNPTISVQPGQEVIIHLTSESGTHNIQVDGSQASEYVNPGAAPITYTFTAPESGSIEYWCVPHKASGMIGTVRVAAAGGEAPAEGEEDDLTGETIDLGQYDPACQGRKAPAVVTRDIVGGPTLRDYIERCKAGDSGPQGFVQQPHPVDFVLPASFALIGLGIVAVVWVHKYYKP